MIRRPPRSTRKESSAASDVYKRQPKAQDLFETVEFIKSKFKDKLPKVLYGGSVNPQNITILREINNIDGFLIGGASQNAKKFIDIVKKTYI